MMVDRVAHSASLLLVLLVALGMSHASALEASGATGPAVREINTNLEDYPNGQVPRYEKLELTFEVDTLAENPQLPHDAAPPPGVEPEIGVSVDALFTFDDWQTVYTQPAFYCQEFEDQVKSSQEWFCPTGNFSWKVRFAPHEAGRRQFKLRAQDSSGIYETEPQSFTVVSSNNKGFVRVSQTDSRYFEYDDGT